MSLGLLLRQNRRSETHQARMAYRAHLLRGKYRLLHNERCIAASHVKMNISEFHIAAQLIIGMEVSVSLPTVFMCPRRQ